MATLAVQEAMGMKVDREAVATLVLPQLWAMSMGPRELQVVATVDVCSSMMRLVLTVSQFKRFMEVIKKLGDRVEKEHDQYLRDSQRIEDRSAITQNGANAPKLGPVDFESLVGGGPIPGPVQPSTEANGNGAELSWEDDVWGSLLSSNPAVSLCHT